MQAFLPNVMGTNDMCLEEWRPASLLAIFGTRGNSKVLVPAIFRVFSRKPFLPLFDV